MISSKSNFLKKIIEQIADLFVFLMNCHDVSINCHCPAALESIRRVNVATGIERVRTTCIGYFNISEQRLHFPYQRWYFSAHCLLRDEEMAKGVLYVQSDAESTLLIATKPLLHLKRLCELRISVIVFFPSYLTTFCGVLIF